MPLMCPEKAKSQGACVSPGMLPNLISPLSPAASVLCSLGHTVAHRSQGEAEGRTGLFPVTHREGSALCGLRTRS